MAHSCQIYLKYLIYILSSSNVNEVHAQQKRTMIKFPVYLAVGGGLFFQYGSLFGQHLAEGVVGSGRQLESKACVLVPFCATALSV